VSQQQPTWSDDRQWWWDGGQWRPASEYHGRSPAPAPSQQQVTWSEDRQWWWDGSQWRPASEYREARPPLRAPGGRSLRLPLLIGTVLVALVLAGVCSQNPGPFNSNSVVVQGSGTQNSPLLTTDDSLYRVTWHATNLVPDVDFPDLPCGFDIVYFKAGGGGAENGGGAFGATTLRTDSPNGPGPAEVTGSTTFRPHPGQGYLEVNACARAQYVVTMEKA
jgi:hypothetical protein